MTVSNLVKSVTLLSAVGLFSSLSAQATTIDFDSAATANCTAIGPDSVSGFTLTNGDFNNTTSCAVIAPTAHSGNQYMLNYNDRIASFTRDSGTFDLDNLWIHADARSGSTTVRFQGLDALGGNILNTMDIVIDAVWQQINFSGWNNIKTFTWDSISPASSNIAIDDFTFDVARRVPEPATLGLLGLGLVGLGLAGRRRRAAV
ncbi:PEP-CTERM sorting domain-containing protein [Paremcibacter congregatus]|uniref:Ice-binding protein C-terminal domain-containing protein n=1 Tax=Paremcibacter congregatus TaxID=2043170 RepID=A0A2G4YTS3_9PROT|nr:PEP-CTERM sorting domain-containing protein [Paremcibacter congregatus]PHZ84856.1 hypothetical protein CRD36_09010 [Paremcibacter congregatus]QDE26170.1 PEP-CTERM sorting domain-containing protein [Paremcibacter congregatus]